MTTFRHSGKCGDIIFSLPLIRELGGGAIYIPQNMPDNCTGMLDNMRRLLLAQPYITEVREYPSDLWYMETAPDIEVDYDLDLARMQPAKGMIHIVRRYLDAFGVKIPNWHEPWLSVQAEKRDYTVVNYTGRHVINEQYGVASKVNWREAIASIPGEKYFVGTREEHEPFSDLISYRPTIDAMELAEIVAGAKAIYCNQSLTLALAQAIGVPYWCDFKPMKNNCKLFIPIEHEL